MGLFRRQDAEASDEPLSPTDALAGIAVCATWCDGSMSADEDVGLAHHLERLRPFRGMDDGEVDATVRRAQQRAASLGDEAALAACAAALPAEMRGMAYLLAADVLIADDRLEREEARFLDDLRARLGVEPALAQRIRDVLALRGGA